MRRRGSRRAPRARIRRPRLGTGDGGTTWRTSRSGTASVPTFGVTGCGQGSWRLPQPPARAPGDQGEADGEEAAEPGGERDARRGVRRPRLARVDGGGGGNA